jgi:hypothetical protein
MIRVSASAPPIPASQLVRPSRVPPGGGPLRLLRRAWRGGIAGALLAGGPQDARAGGPLLDLAESVVAPSLRPGGARGRQVRLLRERAGVRLRAPGSNGGRGRHRHPDARRRHRRPERDRGGRLPVRGGDQPGGQRHGGPGAQDRAVRERRPVGRGRRGGRRPPAASGSRRRATAWTSSGGSPSSGPPRRSAPGEASRGRRATWTGVTGADRPDLGRAGRRP